MSFRPINSKVIIINSSKTNQERTAPTLMYQTTQYGIGYSSAGPGISLEDMCMY